MNEEINFDDIEFEEPIEEKELNYRDGYIQGIYRARNIIDSKQKEIERLKQEIDKLVDTIEDVNRKFSQYKYESKKEIERLKKREQECIDHYLVQCKYASEMEDKYVTANNIINELEKWIKENDLGKYRTENVVNTDELLDKLQELKHKKIYGSVDSEIVYFDELGSDKE